MFAVIYIRDFSLQASLRHDPDWQTRPTALMGSSEAQAKVIEFNSLAGRQGVGPGLTATQATARCGGLLIKNRSPAQEKAATELLLQTAYVFSPVIESTTPGVCTMDLKGLAEPCVDPMAWAGKIITALGQFQLEASIGLASTPDLARIAARTAQPVLLIKDAAGFLANLPVEMLQPPIETTLVLHRWGIRTVGEFLALGKDNMAERLGPVALKLFDLVSTDSIRPLILIQPSEEFSEQMEFEQEIETVQPLLFVLRRFVEQLAARLEMIGLVVAEFQLRFILSSGASCEQNFKIPAPTGHVETLFRMLSTWLETARTDSPIVSLQLSAYPGHREIHQFGLFEVSLRNPNQFAETLARLTALFGADRVGTPVPEATHRPDAFRLVSPHFNETSTIHTSEQPTGLQLRRYRPALTAKVEFHQGQPVLIRSQICTGPIQESRGPFNLSGDWWDQRQWAREEWDIQTVDGALYRIAFTGLACQVEGIYD